MRRVLLSILPAVLLGLAVPSRADDKIPEGFVEQVLEPTGGKLLRPKDWFFRESHRETAFMWTVSKEDTKDGSASYETGVRIQVFPKVLERTTLTAEEQARKFLAEKKKAAAKIHREFPLQEQDLFSRLGLESEEGKYHIMYSIFWSNKLDMLVVSISGTPSEEWDKYAETFNTMGAITLIDMERFKDKPDKEAAKSGEEGEKEKKAEKP